MARVVHFEVMAEDPHRAIKFYTNVFDWEIKQWGTEKYWLVNTEAEDEPGINGAIGKSKGEPLTVNTVEVSSIDEFAGKVVEYGGEVVVPKMAIPSVGYVVYCKDTEGIVFGLIESDPAAK